MAKDPKIYEDALEHFKSIYPMESYDLGKVMTRDKQFRFFNGTNNSTPAQEYARWASATMSMYFNHLIMLKETGSSTIKGFKLSQFLEEFEKLVDAKYRSELNTETSKYAREPREGASEEEVKNACHRSAAYFKKTMPTLWKENIKADFSKIEKMKTITDGYYQQLSLSGFGDEDDDFDRDALKDELTNLVTAYEAMKQVRESRKGFFGFFWKLFNGDQNAQEEAYLATLEGQVKMLEAKNYDIAGVTNAVNGKTAFGKSVNYGGRTLTPEQEKERAAQVAKNMEGFERTKTLIEDKEGKLAEFDLYNDTADNSQVNEIDEETRTKIDGDVLNQDVNGKENLETSEIKIESMQIDDPSLKNT